MREMAEYLPNTHKDLSLESQNPGKKGRYTGVLGTPTLEGQRQINP